MTRSDVFLSMSLRRKMTPMNTWKAVDPRPRCRKLCAERCRPRLMSHMKRKDNPVGACHQFTPSFILFSAGVSVRPCFLELTDEFQYYSACSRKKSRKIWFCMSKQYEGKSESKTKNDSQERKYESILQRRKVFRKSRNRDRRDFAAYKLTRQTFLTTISNLDHGFFLQASRHRCRLHIFSQEYPGNWWCWFYSFPRNYPFSQEVSSLQGEKPHSQFTKVKC